MQVYMVKVSPVGDIPPLQADGSHVLIVYNTQYTDTEQVTTGFRLPLPKGGQNK